MPYKLKPRAYVDNQALALALRANRQSRDLLRRILEEKPARGLLYQLLAEMAHALGDELDALNTMKEIRITRGEKVKAPGTPPGASTDER